MPDQQLPKPRTDTRKPVKELDKDLRLKVLRAMAVQQALGEIVDKYRSEIIALATAKLKAFGITVTPEELEKRL